MHNRCCGHVQIHVYTLYFVFSSSPSFRTPVPNCYIYSGNNDAWRLKISVHILLQKKAWHDYGWRNEGSNTPKTNENRQHTIQVRLNSAIKIFLISSLNQFLWWHCYKTVVTFYLWHISFQWKQNGKVLKALWRKVEREDENVLKESIHAPSVKKDRNNSNRPV